MGRENKLILPLGTAQTTNKLSNTKIGYGQTYRNENRTFKLAANYQYLDTSKKATEKHHWVWGDKNDYNQIM